MSDIKKHLDIRSGDSHIQVDRIKVMLYVPPAVDRIVARTRGPFTYILVGDQALEMGTPVAVKVGLALAAAGDECIHTGDMVKLAINGTELHLLPERALQLGGILARKADRADDWQRAHAH